MVNIYLLRTKNKLNNVIIQAIPREFYIIAIASSFMGLSVYMPRHCQ